MKVAAPFITTIALALVTLLWVSAPAQPVAAANVLTNPTFDANITGWNLSGGATITHSAATGNPAGSASIVVTTVGNSAQSISQCVPATAGETYDISSQVLLPTANQPAGTVAFMTRNFNATADCTGGAVPGGGGQTSDFNPSDSWQTISFGSLVAPPATQGLLIVLFVFGSDPVGAEQSHAFFDNANVDWQGGPTSTPSATSTVTATPSPAATQTAAPSSTSSAHTHTPTSTATRTSTPVPGASTPAGPHATSTPPGGGSGAGVVAPPDTGSGQSPSPRDALFLALASAFCGALGVALVARGTTLRSR